MSVSPTPLELTPAARAALGRAALDWCLEYFDTMHALPVYPSTHADHLQSLLREPLPQHPQPWPALIEQFAHIVQHSRHNGHPRMFGYVQSSATFAGVVGDLLASALNANVTSWRSAPAATTIERQVIAWLAAMIDLPETSGGLLVSGGSMANFSALAAALRAASDVDVATVGVAALGARPRIYASSMAHMSIAKAAGLLGLGTEAVQYVPVNSAFEMDVGALDAMLMRDGAGDALPVAVVATAGDVNTGAIDPLDPMADLCARHGVWLHVDASYGGFAALVPGVRDRLQGLGRADSVALDPHKWLYAPLDVGCLLVRNPPRLREAFTHHAAYVDVVADAQMSEFAFWDYGPELSRRFRALKIWFALKLHGVTAFADAIAGNLEVAQHLAALVDASDDFQRLAPVPLSIVCFRFVPRDMRDAVRRGDSGARERVDDLNRRVLLELQREGQAYLSNTEIDGAFALRACLANYRTTRADAEHLLGALRRIAERLWYAH